MARNHLFLGAILGGFTALTACEVHVIDPIGGGASGGSAGSAGSAGSVPSNVAGTAGDGVGGGDLDGGGDAGMGGSNLGGGGNQGRGGSAGIGGSPTNADGGVAGFIQQPPDPNTCLQIAAATKEQTANSGACTLVVRVSASSLQILGYALKCGALAAVNEADAEANALAAFELVPSFGNGASNGASNVRNMNPETAASGEWVFWGHNDDANVAAVSVRGGVPLFFGQLHWYGNGWGSTSLTTPGSWNVNDPGVGCSEQVAPALGVVNLGASYLVTRTAEAAAVVMRTALVSGLNEFGGIVDGLVGLYPGEGIYPGQPGSAQSGFLSEYIVMLNAVAKP